MIWPFKRQPEQRVPPRLSEMDEESIRSLLAGTNEAAAKVSKKFEKISNDAIAIGKDPLAVLIHEVKGASFKRQIREDAEAAEVEATLTTEAEEEK